MSLQQALRRVDGNDNRLRSTQLGIFCVSPFSLSLSLSFNALVVWKPASMFFFSLSDDAVLIESLSFSFPPSVLCCVVERERERERKKALSLSTCPPIIFTVPGYCSRNNTIVDDVAGVVTISSPVQLKAKCWKVDSWKSLKREWRKRKTSWDDLEAIIWDDDGTSVSRSPIWYYLRVLMG